MRGLSLCLLLLLFASFACSDVPDSSLIYSAWVASHEYLAAEMPDSGFICWSSFSPYCNYTGESPPGRAGFRLEEIANGNYFAIGYALRNLSVGGYFAYWCEMTYDSGWTLVNLTGVMAGNWFTGARDVCDCNPDRGYVSDTTNYLLVPGWFISVQDANACAGPNDTLVITDATYYCGDCNGDFYINVGDAVFLINFVFKGGPAPNPSVPGNPNCDDFMNIGDAVYMINHIFKSGPEPCANCP